MFIPYLNRGLNALSKEQYKKRIVTILVIWSIIPAFTGHAWKFGDYDTFVFMRIVGGYLGKHYVADKEKREKSWNLFNHLCRNIYLVCDGNGFLRYKAKQKCFFGEGSLFKKYIKCDICCGRTFACSYF